MTTETVEAAQIVLPCKDLDATLAFFTERLGFRLETIHPADDPSVAVISGYGVRLELARGGDGAPGVLRLLCDDPRKVADGAAELMAPNGTRIELVDANPPLVVPATKSSFVLSRNDDEAPWHAGRAGMRYRDLIPDRLSGAFIASHIQVPNAGLVPDYVHFHKIRFQMIYIYKGWVRVLYEDQGPAFVMQAGDCVLQPPFIRHRVLETSGGFEVIEIGHPAEHETFADHQMELPKPTEDPTRDFSGQQWVCHYAANATWAPFRIDGFECRDIGIGAATKGLASVRVARLSGKPSSELVRHDAEFLFTFVLEGGMTLRRSEGDDDRLGAGDAFVVPASMSTAFADCTEDLELLEVALPAGFATSAS